MTNIKCECKNCKCFNKKVAAIILAVGLLIGGGIVFLINNRNIEDVVLEQAISIEEAKEKTLNVINQHMLPPEITASLIGAITERGLHKITVDIQGQEVNIYLTKDGALLFPEAIDLNALVVASGEQEKREFTQDELIRLAKRLTDKGIIFFGTYQCPWCIKQKEMFGEAAKFLFYIECHPNRATEEELALCKEANVDSVPDWRFPGKEPILGMLSIERLIELSGCGLLEYNN